MFSAWPVKRRLNLLTYKEKCASIRQENLKVAIEFAMNLIFAVGM